MGYVIDQGGVTFEDPIDKEELGPILEDVIDEEESGAGFGDMVDEEESRSERLSSERSGSEVSWGGFSD